MTYARYRHLAIERARPAPTAAQLSAIEELLGARLSSSFREFLRVANGGYVEYMIDVSFDNDRSEPLCFCDIFCADDGDFLDGTFVGEIRSSRQHQGIPAGVLPFARDGGGSMVYLDLSEQGKGRVIAFVEGLPEWTGLRTQSAYIELASSFDEYVDKLRIDREMIIDQLQHDARTEAHVDATEEWLDIGVPNWRGDAVLAAAMADARRRVKGGN